MPGPPPKQTMESGPDLTGMLLENRYKVLTALGHGGMGSVYLARDRKLGDRKVVIKIPHARMLNRVQFRRRFQQEIHSLVRLEYPHVVRIYDIGNYSDYPFAVLQYLAGGSLKSRLETRSGTMHPEEVLEWLPTIARSLDFIHRKGYIHRDVKPGNILFDSEGHVFLSDFGIVKMPEHRDLALTYAGQTPGAPAFMPPEVVNVAPATPAYDQYSLGVCVFLALGGRFPHQANDTQSLMRQKATQLPIPLHMLSPEIPRSVVGIVVRALAADPDERFGSCSAFARAYHEEIKSVKRRRSAVHGTHSGRRNQWAKLLAPLDRLWTPQSRIAIMLFLGIAALLISWILWSRSAPAGG